MGPDEFHEKYPGAAEGGLRNNAYTNVMVAWICETAQKVLDAAPREPPRRAAGEARPRRRGDAQVGGDEPQDVRARSTATASSASSRATRTSRSSTGTPTGERYGNIQRLDRILRAEGDDPNRYKLAKQADTVMLFFLFSEDELRRLFERLGYEYAADTARKTIDYYDRRTSHGSTLSFVAHAGVLAAHRPRELVGAVPGRAGERRRRRPGRDDAGGHPHGRDVPGRSTSSSGPTSAATIRDGVAALRSEAHRPARRAVVPDAVPRHADQGDARSEASSRSRRSPRASAAPIRVGVGDDVRELGAGRALHVHARRSAAVARELDGERSSMHRRFRGAIFDVDGVLVDSPHERAWRDTLRELMEGAVERHPRPDDLLAAAFTPQVYQQSMSGKPRMSGARAALDYFQVPDAERRAEVYAERKQKMVVALIEAGEFTAFPDALRFIIALRGAGIRVAAASSSKNAAFLADPARHVRRAGSRLVRPGLTLLDFFDADVSGRDFAHGKPHPEIFLIAAQRARASRRGRASWSRTPSPASRPPRRAAWRRSASRAADDVGLLAEAGADLVVTSLDDVDVGRLAQGRLVVGAAR